jgi:hypothetical protein
MCNKNKNEIIKMVLDLCLTINRNIVFCIKVQKKYVCIEKQKKIVKMDLDLFLTCALSHNLDIAETFFKAIITLI